MMRRINFLMIIFFLVSYLSGCASTVKPQATPEAPLTPQEEKKRDVSLANLQNWQLSGKVAVISAKESGSASIDWVQRGSHFNISLMGPLGTHSVKLKGGPGGVTMDSADGKHASAGSPEALVEKQMGWSLPVSNMRYWIKGSPVPSLSQQTSYDGRHRLTRLVQDGWNIQYLDYRNMGAYDLPQRININSNSLKVKIIIYNWNV